MNPGILSELSLSIFQDGSLLQTYIGNGCVRNMCWFADHGLAACFNRTKVIAL